MSGMDTKRYSTYIIIIIAAILLLQIASSLFTINQDLIGLITNFLFATGTLFLLFGWEFKIFKLLNVFGFVEFNIGLITNNLIKPDWISGELNINLLIVRWIMTIMSFLIILAAFQNQLKLGSWKVFVKIDKRKIVMFYVLGVVFLQFIVRLT